MQPSYHQLAPIDVGRAHGHSVSGGLPGLVHTGAAGRYGTCLRRRSGILSKMREERFEAVSKGGAQVLVRWRPDNAEVEVQVGSETYRPAWGSQGCDDWLDWIAARHRGEPMTLPVDEDDWLLDEGYHRR